MCEAVGKTGWLKCATRFSACSANIFSRGNTYNIAIMSAYNLSKVLVGFISEGEKEDMGA